MSIKKKLLASVIALVLAVGVLLAGAQIAVLFEVSRFQEQANGEMTREVTQRAELDMRAVGDMMNAYLSGAYSQIVDENFQRYGDWGASIARELTWLYSLSPPAASQAENRAWQLSPGVAFDQVAPEYRQIAAVYDYVQTMEALRTEAIRIYIQTESGLFLPLSRQVPAVDADFRTSEWYRGAKDKGGVYWANLYPDTFTGKPLITCGTPFYANGVCRGVIAIDFYLEDFSRSVLEIDSQFVVDSLLFDQNGNWMTSTRDSGIYEALAQSGETVFFDEMHRAQQTNTDRVDAQTFDPYTVYFLPQEHTGWVVCVVVEFGVFAQSAQDILQVVEESGAVFSQRMGRQIQWGVLLAVLVLCVVLLAAVFVINWMTKKITGPIGLLVEATRKVGQGDLEARADGIQTGDEIETLADAFNSMTSSLAGHVRDTARMSAELQVATRIQKGFIPKTFPERREFSLFAMMETAKEVGGDFYDFFLLDDRHLALVIADVSDKGIPAALFMVVTRTVIRDLARRTLSPAQILTQANRILSEENEAGMFTTVLLCVLDIQSGQLTVANAGHNPPFLCRRGGVYAKWEIKPDLVLAALDATVYHEQVLRLGPGDRLFFYTDGLTEAFNQSEEPYGEGRAEQYLNSHTEESLTDVLTNLWEDTRRFADGRELSDDLTLMILEFYGDAGI